MPTPDDGQLWAEAQRGSPDAVGALFDRHANAIYTYCFRRTGDWALAEDLTSAVFFELLRSRRGHRLSAEAVRPWLFGIALNVIRNQARATRRYRAALERIPPLEAERDFADELVERLADELAMRDILRTIRKLPEPEQDAFTLCAWEGFSSAEAAEILNVPETTVRTRVFRARQRLRSLGTSQADEELTPERIRRDA